MKSRISFEAYRVIEDEVNMMKEKSELDMDMHDRHSIIPKEIAKLVPDVV